MRWHSAILILLVFGIPSHAANAHVRDGMHDAVPMIVFLGGGNVERSRYSSLLVDFLETKNNRIKTTKIVATGCTAELGAYRLRNDVLPVKPSLLVLDFTGEDRDTPTGEIAAAVEGIIRQTWRADATTDLLIVDDSDAIEAVAEHYGIPSVKRTVPTALSTTNPTTASDPVSDAIISTWPALTAKSVAKHALPTKMNPACLENVSMAAPPQLAQGWSEIESKESPDYDAYRRLMPRMWQAEPGASTLELKFTGRKISLQLLSTAGSGRLSVQVDFGEAVSLRVDEPNNPTPHGRVMVIADALAAGEHRLKIVPVGGPVTIGQFLFVGE